MRYFKTFMMVVVLIFTIFFTGCGSESNILEDITGVWRANSDGAIVSLDLSGETKSINVNGSSLPVSIKDIDNNNGIVSVNLDLRGQAVVWALKQVWDEDGKSFFVEIVLHNGNQDSFSFVRSL